jgi:hypothetical protein
MLKILLLCFFGMLTKQATFLKFTAAGMQVQKASFGDKLKLAQ